MWQSMSDGAYAASSIDRLKVTSFHDYRRSRYPPSQPTELMSISAFEVSQDCRPSLSRYFSVSIPLTDDKIEVSGVWHGGSKRFSTTQFFADLVGLGTGRCRASSHVARLWQHISERHRRGRVAGCSVDRDRGDLLAKPVLALGLTMMRCDIHTRPQWRPWERYARRSVPAA